MKRNKAAILFAALGIAAAAHASDDDDVPKFLEGDTRYACEAILCLAASGGRPHECAPSIRRFFEIQAKKPWKTIALRRSFLQLCPNRSADMDRLTNALANGSGNCDANTLNAQLLVYDRDSGASSISSAMPDYCRVYAENPYTQAQLPIYVGVPSRGGLWADPQNYEAEKAAYEARVRREDEILRQQQSTSIDSGN